MTLGKEEAGITLPCTQSLSSKNLALDVSLMSHHQTCWVLSSLFSDAKDRLSLEFYSQEEQPWMWLSTFNEDSVFISPGALLQGQALPADSIFKEETLVFVFIVI